MSNPRPKITEEFKKQQFKKGQSGNPKGGPKIPDTMKKLKSLTEAELVEVGTVLLKGKLSELKALAKDPHTTVIQAMVAGMALKAISRGDSPAFNAIMDRLLGKVKENLNLSGNIGGTSRVVLMLPRNGSEAPDEKE